MKVTSCRSRNVKNDSFKRSNRRSVTSLQTEAAISTQSFPWQQQQQQRQQQLNSCACGRWWLTELWHHTDWQVCSCTKRFSVQSSRVVTRQSIWEMKTCTPVTCCVQCFLESHYFWINLCWWQFHCLLLLLLLWWYYYGAFILLLFCVG